jgi:hypothetical protein
MSRAIQDATACREALARLPKLGLGELRQHWRVLYKADASPHLSRELLLRAVANRMQEVALGGLRPERQRQLRQFAQQLNESQERRIRPRPELKPGTRLVREWQGRTYEVVVLDDGFSWQGTSYRSLSALARKITGTAWSGPLFFGLKPNRPATRRSSQPPHPASAPTAGSNAAG